MYEHLYSFRDIDEAFGRPKGTAFRSFKRIRSQLVEGQDYLYLSGEAHAATIQALRDSGRVYASTIHAVLFTEEGYRRVAEVLEDGHA